ncbi:MAG: fatty acid desaturase [Labilithrix sp.]|nr:fatty acid desaturase [Labilithrix sp.]
MTAPERSDAPWIRAALLAGKPYRFRTKRALFHNALNLTALAGVLAAFGTVLALGRGARPWPYLPLATLAFGWCYFALFVLVVHEASHGMFVLARDRRTRERYNRIFGWLACLPFAIHYARHWEEGHVIHHRIPIEEDDPQRFNRLTGARLARDIALLVFVPGYAFVHRFMTPRARARKQSSAWLFVVFFALWTCVVFLAWRCISPSAGVALVLGLQILAAYNQLKGALEHGGPIAFERSAYLRSRTSLFFGRRWLLPFNQSLHFEHHLNFTVPWYDLPRYRRALLSIVPRELHDEVWNRDIWGQLAGDKGALPDHLRRLAYRRDASP